MSLEKARDKIKSLNSESDYLDLSELKLTTDDLSALIRDNELFFNGLKKLNLERNNLSSLPDNLCDLDNLQTLYLGYNKLTTLPDSIKNLTKTKIINIMQNEEWKPTFTLYDDFENKPLTFNSKEECYLVAITNFYYISKFDEGGNKIWYIRLDTTDIENSKPSIITKFFNIVSQNIPEKDLRKTHMNKESHNQVIALAEKYPPKEIWKLYQWFAEQTKNTVSIANNLYLDPRQRAILFDNKIFPSNHEVNKYIKQCEKNPKNPLIPNVETTSDLLIKVMAYSDASIYFKKLAEKKPAGCGKPPGKHSTRVSTGGMNPRISENRNEKESTNISHSKQAMSRAHGLENADRFLTGNIQKLIEGSMAKKHGANSSAYAIAQDPRLCAAPIYFTPCSCQEDSNENYKNIIDDKGDGIKCQTCNNVVGEYAYNFYENAFTNARPWILTSRELPENKKLWPFMSHIAVKADNFNGQDHSETLVRPMLSAASFLLLYTEDCTKLAPAQIICLQEKAAEALHYQGMKLELYHKNYFSNQSAPTFVMLDKHEMVENLFVCLNAEQGPGRLASINNIRNNELSAATFFIVYQEIAQKVKQDISAILQQQNDHTAYQFYCTNESQGNKKDFINSLFEPTSIENLTRYTEHNIEEYLRCIDCLISLANISGWIENEKIIKLSNETKVANNINNIKKLSLKNIIDCQLTTAENRTNYYDDMDNTFYNTQLETSLSKRLKTDFTKDKWLLEKITTLNNSTREHICTEVKRRAALVKRRATLGNTDSILHKQTTYTRLVKFFMNAISKCSMNSVNVNIIDTITQLCTDAGNMIAEPIANELKSNNKILQNITFCAALLSKIIHIPGCEVLTSLLIECIVEKKQIEGSSNNHNNGSCASKKPQISEVDHITKEVMKVISEQKPLHCTETLEKLLASMAKNQRYLEQIIRAELLADVILPVDFLTKLIEKNLFRSISMKIIDPVQASFPPGYIKDAYQVIHNRQANEETHCQLKINLSFEQLPNVAANIISSMNDIDSKIAEWFLNLVYIESSNLLAVIPLVAYCRTSIPGHESSKINSLDSAFQSICKNTQENVFNISLDVIKTLSNDTSQPYITQLPIINNVVILLKKTEIVAACDTKNTLYMLSSYYWKYLSATCTATADNKDTRAVEYLKARKSIQEIFSFLRAVEYLKASKSIQEIFSFLAIYLNQSDTAITLQSNIETSIEQIKNVISFYNHLLISKQEQEKNLVLFPGHKHGISTVIEIPDSCELTVSSSTSASTNDFNALINAISNSSKSIIILGQLCDLLLNNNDIDATCLVLEQLNCQPANNEIIVHIRENIIFPKISQLAKEDSSSILITDNICKLLIKSHCDTTTTKPITTAIIKWLHEHYIEQTDAHIKTNINTCFKTLLEIEACSKELTETNIEDLIQEAYNHNSFHLMLQLLRNSAASKGVLERKYTTEAYKEKFKELLNGSATEDTISIFLQILAEINTDLVKDLLTQYCTPYLSEGTLVYRLSENFHLNDLIPSLSDKITKLSLKLPEKLLEKLNDGSFTQLPPISNMPEYVQVTYLYNDSSISLSLIEFFAKMLNEHPGKVDFTFCHSNKMELNTDSGTNTITEKNLTKLTQQLNVLDNKLGFYKGKLLDSFNTLNAKTIIARQDFDNHEAPDTSKLLDYLDKTFDEICFMNTNLVYLVFMALNNTNNYKDRIVTNLRQSSINVSQTITQSLNETLKELVLGVKTHKIPPIILSHIIAAFADENDFCNSGDITNVESYDAQQIITLWALGLITPEKAKSKVNLKITIVNPKNNKLLRDNIISQYKKMNNKIFTPSLIPMKDLPKTLQDLYCIK